jgi:GDPmannose 4,6-dehydratase
MENQKQNQKVALITGITGQSGSFLAELLLEKGYIVHGIIRRSATFNTQNIEHIFDKLHLHHGDITDTMNVFNIISKVRPCEIYNLCAMSHVKVSHELENYTFQTNTLGILSILQSVKNLGMEKTCKIYQASTSEIFGNITDGSFKLNEDSPQNPCSVYAISKYAAQQLCNMYRDAYGMFVVNSLLFNHEGSRRGHTFVTQKIADYVGKYYATCNLPSVEFNEDNETPFPLQPLQLGNLNARRDWGSAEQYMKAVYLMLQQENPDNYVIATGETHSVREFIELAFKEIGIDIEWIGKGVDEVGVEKNNKKRILVQVNPKYYRDIDIECLIGDASKAKRELGWTYDLEFKDLVKDMVVAAINRIGYWDLGTPYVSLDVKKL